MAGGPNDATDALSFAEVLRLARAAPAVAGARRAAGDKAAMSARISRMTHSPQVAVAAGYRALPEEDRGVEAQVSVQQPFNLAGLRGRRDRAVRLEEQALLADAQALDLGQRARAANVEASDAQRLLEGRAP